MRKIWQWKNTTNKNSREEVEKEKKIETLIETKWQ